MAALDQGTPWEFLKTASREPLPSQTTECGKAVMIAVGNCSDLEECQYERVELSPINFT